MRFKKTLPANTRTRLIFVSVYIILITLFDAYGYGIVYQQKIKEENYTNQFWSWVFHETGRESATEHIQVPRYRIIQKSIEAVGIIIVLYFCGVWTAIGLLLSHYLMTYDLLFYLVLNKTYLFGEFQKYNSTYWLQNWYQSGYFILQPFNSVYFHISGIMGIVIPVAFCFIKLPKKQNLKEEDIESNN